MARRAAVGGARVRALDLRRHASTSARLSTSPRDIYGVDHNDMVRVVPQRVVPLALEVGNLPTPFLQYIKHHFFSQCRSGETGVQVALPGIAVNERSPLSTVLLLLKYVSQ